jgi:hypothetical protein
MKKHIITLLAIFILISCVKQNSHDTSYETDSVAAIDVT